MIKKADIVMVIIISIVVTICWYFAYPYVHDLPNRVSVEKEEEVVEDNSIDIGTITVRDNGENVYQYIGKIKIINDGTNGEPIDIQVDEEENTQ